jgi:hypothetical protein
VKAPKYEICEGQETSDGIAFRLCRGGIEARDYKINSVESKLLMGMDDSGGDYQEIAEWLWNHSAPESWEDASG